MAESEARRPCRVLRGQFIQYDENGKEHVFNAGDEILLTDKEIEADGGACFDVLRVMPGPLPSPDED